MKNIFQFWVYGGFLSGLALLALSPLILPAWPEPLRLTFLALPVYMLHQFEEHDGDRFRIFVNNLFKMEALTPVAVFVINIPGVWGIIVLACYLCAYVNPGLGVIAIYLMLINAFAHLGQAAALRAYNPGTFTAVVLFIPFALYALPQYHAGLAPQLTGLAAAIAIHVAILVHVAHRRHAQSDASKLVTGN